MEETNFSYNLVLDGAKENTMFTVDREDIGKQSTIPSIIAVGGTAAIELYKIDPITIEKYLWMHPVVPRGIEIKANRMIRRGYLIKGENPQVNKYCEDIIENSGGLIRVKKWIQDTYGFGNGYLTLVLNKQGNKVLKLNQEHPIFFSPSIYPEFYKDKNLAGKYMIDPKTRKPVSYTQVGYDKGQKMYYPVGEPIPSDRVAHLMFDSWGDEPTGISLIQYLQNEIKYLMNIEEAGAETMYRNGFVQKKITTNVRSEKDLKKLAKEVVNINYRDVVICPEGMDVTNLLPGTTQFQEYHKVFLKLVSSRLGIPLPLLTNDGTETNKATLDQMVSDMHEDMAADEKIVEQTITWQIFEPACKIAFGDDFEGVPVFIFKEAKEDKESRSVRLLNNSLFFSNVTASVERLYNIGKAEEADRLLSYLVGHIPEENGD